jgi:hypothetical protein
MYDNYQTAVNNQRSKQIKKKTSQDLPIDVPFDYFVILQKKNLKLALVKLTFNLLFICKCQSK